MLRVTLRGVTGHVLRFVLTIVSVSLGVALVAGTFVLTDSINKTFDSIVEQGSKGLDVQVRGKEAGRTPANQGNQPVREQLPLTLADKLRSVPGVKRVAADIQGSAVLVGKDGTAVRNGGAPTLSFPFRPDDPSLHLVQGRAPTGPGEVVLESSTLKLSGLKVGDRTRAVIGGTPREVTIVGEASFDVGLAGATVVAVDEQTAIRVFAPDGTVPSFSVQATPGTSQAGLRDRVSTFLPSSAEAVTGQTVISESKKNIRDALGFINVFLLVFAFISVFVGAFIIYNTFTMLVAQRTRELALLRALGAQRRQVIGSVLGEAGIVGLLGGLVGIAVGLGLASLLKAFFGTFGLKIAGGLPVLPHTIIWSLVVGIGVTVAAATWPAIRASRIAPVAAMRDDVTATPRGLRLRGIVGGAAVVLGVLAIAAAVTPSEVGWGLFALGAVLTLVGLLIAAPVFARPVIRAVAAPFVLVSGAVGRLARENALRMPRRTATTASALLIGLALVATVSVAAQSTKASVSDLVDSQLTADYVLNGGQQPIPPTVATTVEKLPDVAAIATIGVVPVDVGGAIGAVNGIAADAQGLRENVIVTMTSGSLDALSSGQIAVSDAFAKDHKLAVGQTLTATIGTATGQKLTIGGIFARSQVLNDPAIIVPRALYLRSTPAAQQADFIIYVKAKPGADLAQLRTSLVDTVKPYVVVSVQDAAQFTSDQASQINTLLLLIYALLALAVIIAVLGIVNTLALSVFERTREIGLLRAVGLTRGQLSRTITIEAVATALFGAVLGTVLGLGIGVALQRGLRDQGLETLAIPWGTIIAVLVVAAVAGVIAAVLPAIRAVRLDVLRAIATE
jgi:putative ABC transport system permease protein